jgi:hypothetical protein
LQDYLRVLNENIANIIQKQNAGTITYQIPSTQITWTDPVTNNAITVQLAIQALYGHIDSIFAFPSFSAGPVPAISV